MNKNWRIAVIFIVLGAALIALNSGINRSRSGAVEGPEVSSDAPKLDKSNGLPKLVDIGSEGCIPCQMMEPILEELTKEYKGKLEVVFIDSARFPEIADSYKIRGIPTQIFYDSEGKEFYRHMGFIPKEDILAKFKEHGIKL